ncbi:MAG: IS21 family transposase [Polyangiaceae bacterium]
MTISADKAAEIRRLFFAEHWKRGTIAQQLGVHFDVVARVLGAHGPRAGAPRPEARVLAPYESFIDQTLERYPRLRATRIYDMLRERSYTGSLRSVRRYVRQHRPAPKTEVFVRVETFPGEQAQVDWAHVGTLAVPGGRRALWAFVMVLCYSRATWGELVLDLDIHSLRRSLVRASVHFGGSPRQWLFDNAKTVVVERAGDAVRFHSLLLELAARMHVQPQLCRPHRPQDKGKVERAIRYLKERFFAARPIHSIAHGNAQLTSFCNTIALARPHPRWPERTVADALDEEKGKLLALPDSLPETDLVTPVLVDKTASVQLDTNRYSVPPAYARRTLCLVADDQSVRLLDGAVEVARHERCWGRHQRIEHESHLAQTLELKQGARPAKGRDRLRAEIPGIERLIAQWVDAGHNVGSRIASTLRLLDFYGAPSVGRAVSTMLERGTSDLGALAILCEQHRRRRPAPLPLQLAEHVQDRDVIAHDLGGYDE